jgi:transposase
MREAIEAAAARLRYLPAYAPDLNPIENAYSKIKSHLRKGAGCTLDALWKLVGRSVKAIAPSECAGHCA